MKRKYTLTVAGQPLTFVSDEEQDFVNSVVAQTDRAVTDIMMSSTRCARLDAALITALEYCSEKTKAEKKIRSLEAQISLYEATVERLKRDPALARRESTVEAETNAQIGTSASSDGEAVAEVTKAEVAPEPRDHAQQLKEIEGILKTKSAGGSSRQLKLDEIESLLRK